MGKTNLVVMEELTDPVELAKARVQDERFERNWTWFQSHSSEIYAAHRGKSVCISGEELFVADTTEEALRQAKATHADDDGRFSLYIPRQRMTRIYANRRGVAPML